MNTESIIRYLAWEELFTRYRLLFADWLGCQSDDGTRIIFNSIIHDGMRSNLSDREIFAGIFDKKKNLFSQFIDDTVDVWTAFEKISNQLLNSNDNSKVKYLVSIDSLYPSEFLDILNKNRNANGHKQYIPIAFQYIGDLSLLANLEKRAIIGTRHPQNIDVAKTYIYAIYNKYPNSICVTGLAAGIDSMGVSIFDRSVCFIGENLTQFLNREQKDLLRLQAKGKCLKSGLIMSHVISSNKMNALSAKQALLDRNLFVVLLSNTIHPIEFSIKSGTISAINHAIRNNKPIYSPRILTDDFVQSKYRKEIVFY